MLFRSILDGKLWLIGGCSLHEGAQAVPERTYLRDAIALQLSTLASASTVETCDQMLLPHAIAGSAAPAIAKEGVLVFAGADDGSHYGNPPQLHPGQRAEWYAMDPRAKRVTKVGHLAQGVVTTPLVEWSGVAIVVSGETKPGVRTALVQSVRMS